MLMSPDPSTFQPLSFGSADHFGFLVPAVPMIGPNADDMVDQFAAYCRIMTERAKQGSHDHKFYVTGKDNDQPLRCDIVIARGLNGGGINDHWGRLDVRNTPGIKFAIPIFNTLRSAPGLKIMLDDKHITDFQIVIANYPANKNFAAIQIGKILGPADVVAPNVNSILENLGLPMIKVPKAGSKQFKHLSFSAPVSAMSYRSAFDKDKKQPREDYQDFSTAVRHAVRHAMGRKKFEGFPDKMPLVCDIMLCFGENGGDGQPYTKKPDVDNAVIALYEILNDILRNPGQVSILRVIKRKQKSTKSRVDISIRPITGEHALESPDFDALLVAKGMKPTRFLRGDGQQKPAA